MERVRGRIVSVAAAAACAALIGCGSRPASPDAAPPDAAIGTDQTVTAFEQAWVSFTPENHRTIDAQVSFPPAGPDYDQITLHLALGCPDDNCDYWDRLGWLSVVQDAGTDQERQIEVLRFVTPYRVGAAWDVDVTDLRPLLAGDVTLRIFIDTWVGPGSGNGDGWLVDASLAFHGGIPAHEPIAVVPVWGPDQHAIGDPAAPPATSVTVDVPVAAGSARLRSFVTGHGQGNADNCAEFCSLDNKLTVDDDTRDKLIWRTDCATTAVPGQAGTYQYSRAGWCPGAVVAPWTEDFATSLAAGAAVTVGYDLVPYENTCRPDAATCTGCTLGTSCDYDGGNHTAPAYYLSSVLVLYR
jgi:Peptide-N-glycosidase F, C terminal/Peptide-N-glycosidase F, N terminal